MAGGDQQNDRPPLTAHRDEFRRAIEQEMDAATKAASSDAVHLRNGRRVAQVGGAFQYHFDVENVLTLPADSPGDLCVPRHAPTQAMIVSVEGLRVVISVPVDLGRFIASAQLISDLSHLMRKLIQRVEAYEAKPNAAGDRLLGLNPANSAPTDCPGPIDCDPDKETAIEMATSRDTTFIWGPPGTGKTFTIGAIAEQLVLVDRSVLIVSHTNTAVDGAISALANRLRQRDDMSALLEEGKVIRVGDPVDQSVKDDSDLLVSTHVDRRSAELVARRESLEADQLQYRDDVVRLTRQIDLCEWVEHAGEDIQWLKHATQEVIDCREAESTAASEARRLTEALEAMRPRAASAHAARDAHEQIDRLDHQLHSTGAELDTARQIVATAQAAADEAEADYQRAKVAAPIRAELSRLPDIETQRDRQRDSERRLTDAREQCTAASEALSQAEALLEECTSVGTLTRVWRRLPSPDDQRRKVEAARQALSVADRAMAERQSEAEKVATILSTTEGLMQRLEPLASAPSLEDAKSSLNRGQQSLRSAVAKETDLAKMIDDYQQQRIEQQARFDDQSFDSMSAVEDVLQQERQLVDSSQRAKAEHAKCAESTGRAVDKVAQFVRPRLDVLIEWGLTQSGDGDVVDQAHAVEQAYHHARERVQDWDVQGLRQQRDDANTNLRRIADELKRIEEQLQDVEAVVISEATVVATTLTRCYLRDAIQNRRFDTVILDEASMAPIPALWVAAGLADRAAIAVGDFKQLPPIVISDQDMAKKWLGQDIFDVAGVTELVDTDERVAVLTCNRRMHPQISGIVNELIYQGRLTDHRDTEIEDGLNDWYSRAWGPDAPVLLVDTGKLNAWVTSVRRGARSSRLNFLSATLCASIAEQMLAQDRKRHQDGDRARILIVSPYRPHARLVELLVEEQGLTITGEVLAGTAHSFQGSEADVVIVDLVNDEPHWRVGLFNQANDETTCRLMNVALTRARRRLVIVGDINYNRRQASHAFIGKYLLPFLTKHHKVIDADNLVPSGLTARAARAQARLFGDQDDGIGDSSWRMVTQDHFYPALRRDFNAASRRIVIYSPFITGDRIADLEPVLRGAVDRGVSIYIVTKAHADRSQRELPTYRRLERTLTEWGMVIVHKQRMHEKLVIIDDDVLWSGSLNPLSFRDTQEFMERRQSQVVVSHCIETLRLNELVGEFASGRPSCPICDGEMVACEGRDDPYYWRCVEDDCYKRSIDQPSLDGGMVVCSNCCGPVEFGEWGGKPAWRCIENCRHHQRVARTHLRLPKMRKLIPASKLKQLDKQFGIGQAVRG